MSYVSLLSGQSLDMCEKITGAISSVIEEFAKERKMDASKHDEMWVLQKKRRGKVKTIEVVLFNVGGGNSSSSYLCLASSGREEKVVRKQIFSDILDLIKFLAGHYFKATPDYEKPRIIEIRRIPWCQLTELFWEDSRQYRKFRKMLLDNLACVWDAARLS